MVEQLGSGVPRILRYYPKDCFHFGDSFFRIIIPLVNVETGNNGVVENKKEGDPIDSPNDEEIGGQVGGQAGGTIGGTIGGTMKFTEEKFELSTKVIASKLPQLPQCNSPHCVHNAIITPIAQ